MKRGRRNMPGAEQSRNKTSAEDGPVRMCVCVCVLVAQMCLTLCESMDCSQAPLSMGFSTKDYWSGLPFPSPGGLPDPGIEPWSHALQAGSLGSEPPGKPTQSVSCFLIFASAICLKFKLVTSALPLGYNPFRGFLRSLDPHPQARPLFSFLKVDHRGYYDPSLQPTQDVPSL